MPADTTINLENAFVRSCIEHSKTNVNGHSSAFAAFHDEGLQAFESLGFPLPRTEAWKYTPVRRWLQDYVRKLEAPSAKSPHGTVEEPIDRTFTSSPDAWRPDDGYLVVCKNGIFDENESRISDLPADVFIGPLSTAAQLFPELVARNLGRSGRHLTDVFAALNAGCFYDGLFIHIPENLQLDRSVYIYDRASPENVLMNQARRLIVSESGTSCRIVEIRNEEPSALSCVNLVTEIEVGAGAQVDHCLIYDGGDDSILIHTLEVHQERSSRFSTNRITFGGRGVRDDLYVLPDDEECESHLSGLIVARNEMHVDVHSLVDHAKPGCYSHELFKCIIDHKAVGVFSGKVLVRQDAQQTNAYQSNRTILLSPDARMYSKPELEIYADDVRCSHGATTGRLDEEAIFYLQSRGIHAGDARLLLLEAFAGEVLNLIADESLRARLYERLRLLLSHRVESPVRADNVGSAPMALNGESSNMKQVNQA